MKRRNKVREAGANQRREVANVSDLMASDVQTAGPDEPVSELRERMTRLGINALPVVDTEMVPLGIVTAYDLLGDIPDGAKAAEIMTEDVLSISSYTRVHEAARAMLNHKIHHLVVTHEKKVVGILSSLDIVELVAARRFVMKSPAKKD